MLRSISFCIAFVWLIWTASTSIAQSSGGYHNYWRPPFNFLYAGQDPDIVEDLDRELRSIVLDMELHLGTRLPDRVQIDLPQTRSEFAWRTQGTVPDWAGGVAYPSQGRIAVKTPLFFEEGVPLLVLTAHELAHILLHEASAGKGLPRWFNEGFSQILAGESRQGHLGRLARAAFADRLMGLPRIEDVLRYSAADAELAYAESQAAAQGLLDRFGWETVRSILYIVGTGVEFDKAFEKSTGIEYEAWQADWLESAQRRYKNYAFLDIESIIWVVIMLLSGLAAFAVWWRKRQQFKKWEEEEEEEERLNGAKETNEQEEPVDDKPIHP